MTTIATATEATATLTKGQKFTDCNGATFVTRVSKTGETVAVAEGLRRQLRLTLMAYPLTTS